MSALVLDACAYIACLFCVSYYDLDADLESALE